jgi:hypothetical protein
MAKKYNEVGRPMWLPSVRALLLSLYWGGWKAGFSRVKNEK